MRLENVDRGRRPRSTSDCGMEASAVSCSEETKREDSCRTAALFMRAGDFRAPSDTRRTSRSVPSQVNFLDSLNSLFDGPNFGPTKF